MLNPGCRWRKATNEQEKINPCGNHGLPASKFVGGKQQKSKKITIRVAQVGFPANELKPESNKEEENNMCNLSSIEQYTIYQKNDIIILND